jgi:ATP-dependent helicase HrpA
MELEKEMFAVDPNLPIAEKAEEIRQAILKYPVVIIAGETGSGKSTQIPKICLDLFQEDPRLIGHTQPRRLAARTIADRVAEETKTPLGVLVGYKIRFNDSMQKTARLKLMTDGILLAEIERDRYLSAYKAIIIDEAHERSLNIDFLLGYLKRILPRRPDLKIIITSATLDHQKFSEHFNQAPLIEVSGRTYPVSLRYRPLWTQGTQGTQGTQEFKASQDSQGSQGFQGSQSIDLNEGILMAISELIAAGSGGYLGGGDILIFLATEREIRDCQAFLAKKNLRGVDVLPLFGRLSIGDQQKIFSPSGKRKIVLSTNVAETSVTVPGVHYVIDAGMVRLSRYSHRSKIQRLPIEPISKASANQRAGRCGRVAPGICIRLYSEEDFNLRKAFTEPEILRTNLAGVILKMAVMGLGRLEDFPFLTMPDSKFIKDGYKLLHELGAMTAGGEGDGEYQNPEILSERDSDRSLELRCASKPERSPGAGKKVLDPGLRRQDGTIMPAFTGTAPAFAGRTPVCAGATPAFAGIIPVSPGKTEKEPELLPMGRIISKFSVDPRLAKMLVTANQKKVLRELLIITSFLSIQDVRERPMDHQAAADAAHRSFWFGGSDFLTILVLWQQAMVEQVSHTERRNFCRTYFLNFMRLREWGDLFQQLSDQVEQLGWKLSPLNQSVDAENLNKKSKKYNEKSQDLKNKNLNKNLENFLEDLKDPVYQSRIHQSALSGLLSHVGRWEENKRYQGARQGKWELFPGSVAFSHPPKWMMCYELVETHKAFARMIGKIDPIWLEHLASHLIKKSYSEPFYEEKSGRICAWMKISLYGLDIIPKRAVNYSDIDPVMARILFIKEGLVAEKLETSAPFILHNRKLEEDLLHLESKARRLDILADDAARFAFYDQKIPKEVLDLVSFNAWWKRELRENSKNLSALYMTQDDLISRVTHEEEDFPDFWRCPPLKLPLRYHFDPQSEEDGVTLSVPALLLNQLPVSALEWVVPGLLLEKITGLIRSLPKSKRRVCIPAPNFAKACLEALSDVSHRESLIDNVALVLTRLTGLKIFREDFELNSLPKHLFMRVEILGKNGEVIDIYREYFNSPQEESFGMSELDTGTIDALPSGQIWQKTGVIAWDFGDFPREIKSKIHGVEMTLYPVILDKTSSVELNFEQSLEKAELLSRDGILRLFFLATTPERGQFRLQSKRSDDWIKASRNLGSSEKAAREDLEMAILLRLFDVFDSSGLPRNFGAFDHLLQTKKTDFLSVGEELARQSLFILEEYFLLQKKLKKLSGNLAIIESLGDISEQLNSLCYSGFLAKTPIKYFKRLLIYLKGVNIRLERLAHHPLKDREGLLNFRKIVQKNGDKWSQEESRLEAFSTGLASLK